MGAFLSKFLAKIMLNFNRCYPYAYDTSKAATDISTPPGRIVSYLERYRESAGNVTLLPYSCKLRVYRNNLPYEMIRSSQDLRYGAGVKLILDEIGFPVSRIFSWGFMLSPEHADFSNITAHQEKHLVSPSDAHKFSYHLLVQDSMEGEGGIQQSWEEFYNAAINGESILIDLSLLRPSGTANGNGLVATGPVGDGNDESNEASFLAIYEAIATYLYRPSIETFLILFGVLNNTIRRGGEYKNGIITSSMHWTNRHFEEYLKVPLVNIPGSHKKGAGVDTALPTRLYALILDKTEKESLFLEKRLPSSANLKVFPNVCVGLGVPDDGTCLIWRLNLGACKTLDDIVDGYEQTALYLTRLHLMWRTHHPELAQYSAPLEVDRQIGLDVMGLANFLAIHGLSYQEFVDALNGTYNAALPYVEAIKIGMKHAIEICDRLCDIAGVPRFERIFTVEPAQSHSYASFDAKGYTTCAGIWPPIGRRVTRRSDSQTTATYRHGQVETVSSIGLPLYEELHEAWQKLMDSTGRAHMISYNLRQPPTSRWLERFIYISPLQTKYYTEVESTDQSYLEKKAALASDSVPVEINQANVIGCACGD